MPNELFTRRSLLKHTSSLAGACIASKIGADSLLGIDHSKPVSEAAGLTGYLNGTNAFIRLDNRIVLGYRAHKSLKYPYFSPLIGPLSGAPLTSESSLPYPHHRGLWLGCEPLNGGDYWADNSLDNGQIMSRGVKMSQPLDESVTIRDTCEWILKNGPSPLSDERKFTFAIISDRLRVLDIQLKLSALEDVEILKAKHSFFAVRVAPELAPIYGGNLLNSEGDIGAESTYGKTARWCGYYGTRSKQHDIVEGIAILNHPDNFGGGCPWFTRDYGHMSPSPFNFLDKPWRLLAGSILELKYCVALHAGSPQEANLDALYKEWVDGSGAFSSGGYVEVHDQS